MKKHYLLTLVAGCLSCMFVNAQNGADRRLPHQVGKSLELGKTFAFSQQRVATRAAAGVQPDSLVIVSSEGENWTKYLYSYTKEGLLEKTETFVWDALSWGLYEIETNTYDDKGRTLVCTRENADVKSVQTFTYEGNKGSYTTEYNSFSAPRGMAYKGNTTYDDKGNCLTLEEYALVDINGDGVIDASDKNEDGSEPWVKVYEDIYEYDDLGRALKISQKYYANGEIYSWAEATNVWDGKGYEQRASYSENGEAPTMQITKYEVKDGNPMIGSLYQAGANEGEWILTQKDYYYYPKGSETANESVESPAQEAKITVVDGMIQISTPKSMPVQVYSILGSCHYNATVNGSTSVSGLPTGIYVVRANGKALKVCVK